MIREHRILKEIIHPKKKERFTVLGNCSAGGEK